MKVFFRYIKKTGLVFSIALLIFSGSAGIIHSIESGTDAVYDKLKLFTEVFTLVKNNYVTKVDVTELFYGAAKGMMKTLDPFSQFLKPEEYKELQVQTDGAFGGLGIRISIKDKFIIIITPLLNTPAYRAGILPGDKIIKIEGDSVEGFTIDDAVKRLRGKPGTKVNITVLREGEKDPIEFNMVREEIKIKSIQSKVIEKNIGYIRIIEFNADTNDDFDNALSKLEFHKVNGLVIDLRNNPGGLLNSAVAVSKQIIGDNKLIVYTQGRDAKQKIEYHADKESRHSYIPLVLLVNKWTTSAAEILAGVVKDWKRGVLVGTKTFGKGSVQTVIPLSDGSGLRLTTAKYYTPSGVCIHELGISPDIEIDIPKEQLAKIMMQDEKNYPKNSKKVSKEKKKVEDPQLNYAIGLLRAQTLFMSAENPE